MKKIFAKELAALAVLALAFTGCNTAFDGTNANFSEKESEYTDISGATAGIGGTEYNKLGKIECTDRIYKNNNKNVVKVTITSFSKIDLESADKAIHFQQLTNNQTSGYYPIRGTDLQKTRIDVSETITRDSVTSETTTETIITYEVNGTGVTTDKVALFVDAKELKTKGGSAVLALDKNTIRGEESDSFIKYLDADGDTAITGVLENFCPTYSPIEYSQISSQNYVELKDESLHANGVYRFAIKAKDKNKNHPNDAADDWENGLAAKLHDAVVIQYRKPGSRTYEETKLSWTYHDTVSTSPKDLYAAHSYTADTTFDEIGTVWRACITYVDGLDAPAWYKDVYGHPGIVYSAGNGVGAKDSFASGTYTLHKTVPSYIVVNSTAATTGPDATSTYVPTEYSKDAIKTAQASFFASGISNYDNWFEVRTVAGVELDPAAAKDFIVVDANNKKIAADVDVITFSYNDSTATSGKVNYVKITLKDVRYRNYSGFAPADKTLKVLVGSGTKIMENKTYPSQLTFGQWKDVADDDASGYVQIN